MDNDTAMRKAEQMPDPNSPQLLLPGLRSLLCVFLRCSLPFIRPTARRFVLPCYLVTVFGASIVHGQATMSAPADKLAGSKVALVDIGDVFRRLDRFRLRLAQLKQDVDVFEKETRAETEKLEQKKEGLAKYKRPTARVAAEKELTKSAAQLQLKRDLKRQSIAAEEAKMYFAAYLDVRKELEAICVEHQIDVVLRFDRSVVNRYDRDAVMARCNSTIVYQHQLDLTDVLVQRLNGQNRWASRPYGAPTIRGQLGKQSKWLTTIPAIALQQVITARTAWAVDDIVFPDGS